MKKLKYHSDSGFSLLEVLVALIAITFFTAAALQMMVISATFKARAKEYTTATNLIQQDIETVRNEATQIIFPQINFEDDDDVVQELDDNGDPVQDDYLNNKTYLPEGKTTAIVDSLEWFESGDLVQFTGTPDTYNISSISGNEITIASPGLLNRVYQVKGNGATAILVNNTLCDGGVDSGLAAKLEEKIEVQLDSNTTFDYEGKTYEEVIGKSYTIPGTDKKLWLMRTHERTNPEVLEIKYLVVKGQKGENLSTDSKILAELSSEVIPDASYQCIQR